MNPNGRNYQKQHGKGHQFWWSSAYGRKEKPRLRLPCQTEIEQLDSTFDRDDFAERKIGTEKIWDDPMW